MTSTSLPLVSVALITYNQCDFLDQCLESIVAQDYPALEIVVADDASTDGSAALIADYAKRYPDKIVLRIATRNRGVTANQEVALAACTGKYIAWMAGDDLMLPGKIAAQVALMEADENCAVCYHDLDVFDSVSGRSLTLFSQMDRPREGKMELLARFGSFNGATSNMVRSSTCAQMNTNIQTASDWIYYTECLAGGGTIRYIPNVLGRYRRHQANVTASTTQSQPRSLLIEHLQSCAILAGRYPHLVGALRYRQSRLLALQRWEDGGARYGAFLRASLATRFSLPIATALLAHRLFGIRR